MPAPQNDNDINLIDLAATIVRNKRFFYVAFLLSISIGVAAAIIIPSKYQYVSTYQVADTRVGDATRPLEPIAKTIATIENQWLLELLHDYYTKNEEELPFDIYASTPESTTMIQLISVAKENEAALVSSTHENILDQVNSHLDQLVVSNRKFWIDEISAMQALIERLETTRDSGDALVRAIELKTSYENQLEYLKTPETTAIARKGTKKASTNSILIIAGSSILGLFIGVFSALFAGFIHSVRRQLA
ncbi:hypothetical protein [Halomonas casei]|uniref:hypothetical protein n=1 Tax=Halomonas casei TaxID=2742613 RepID=UPI003CF26B6B